MKPPNSQLPANDNAPVAPALASGRRTASTASTAIDIQTRHNILGFFTLLDHWNQAANDNDPKPDAGGEEHNSNER